MRKQKYLYCQYSVTSSLCSIYLPIISEKIHCQGLTILYQYGRLDILSAESDTFYCIGGSQKYNKNRKNPYTFTKRKKENFKRDKRYRESEP